MLPTWNILYPSYAGQWYQLVYGWSPMECSILRIKLETEIFCCYPVNVFPQTNHPLHSTSLQWGIKTALVFSSGLMQMKAPSFGCSSLGPRAIYLSVMTCSIVSKPTKTVVGIHANKLKFWLVFKHSISINILCSFS